MSAKRKEYPTTPDGHYFVVRGRLWRCSNPELNSDERRRLTSELMQARRGVKAAKSDGPKMVRARALIQIAKEGLGERGPVWWRDGGPEVDRCLAKNTPYARWYEGLNLKQG